MDPNDQKKTACYDIDVEVDDPLKAQMSNFLASTTNQQEIASLDAKVWGSPPPFQGSPVSELGELGAGYVLVWGFGMNSSSHRVIPTASHLLSPLQIHETIESINQLKTQRDFMLSFSNNPQDFIQEWIKSQRRDLKVKWEGRAGREAWRLSRTQP